MNTTERTEVAEKAGASRTTLWRIKSGKQNGYNPTRGRSPRRPWIGLPHTRKPILDVIRIGTLCAYPELPAFDRDDLVMEIVLYISDKTWSDENYDAVVMTIAKKIALTWKKDRQVGSLTFRKNEGIRKSYKMLISGTPQTCWPDDFIFALPSENDLQAVLDAAETSSSLYHSFRAMRLSQANYACEKCGNSNNLTLHHILPRKVRCVNTMENTAILCRSCHDRIEYVNDMIRLDGEIPESEYQKIFQSWMKSSSTRFLTKYFGERSCSPTPTSHVLSH